MSKSVRDAVFVFCVGASVALLLISNIAATKLIDVFGLVVDGGIVSFPLAFVLGDVVMEIYGARKAKYIIYTSFAMNLLAAGVFYLVQVLPAGAGWEGQGAYEQIIGFMPRVVAGSLVSYLVAQMLNVAVFDKIRERTGEKWLWLRTLGSSVVANLANSLVFCGVVFWGVVTPGEWWGMVGVSVAVMMICEMALTPVTYGVVKWMRKYA